MARRQPWLGLPPRQARVHVSIGSIEGLMAPPARLTERLRAEDTVAAAFVLAKAIGLEQLPQFESIELSDRRVPIAEIVTPPELN